MLNFGTKSEYVLGISASTRKVEAVLLHNAASGPVVVRTFTRKREGADHRGSAEKQAPIELGADISFEPSTSSDMDTMFLASEFGGVEPTKKDEFSPSLERVGSNVFAQPCDLEIQDIIAECTDAGYENVTVVFALPTENLGTAQIQAQDILDAKSEDKGKKGSKDQTGSKGKKSNKRETLLQQLKSTNSAKIIDFKTTFVPLAETSKGSPSHMAVFALPTEPITLSLQSIRDRKRPFPNVALMDTEPTLMLGLVRAAMISRTPEEGKDGVGLAATETTVLVRVGTEDTLVLFLLGDKLVHFESLRSITAFDPAETICSRILLMHDEFGLSDADTMFLFADAGELGMYQNLSQFFPQTRIKLLREFLPHFSEERAHPLEKEGLLATAVTLRLVRDELYQAVFPEVDFLEQKLKGRRFHLPFSWPVAAMILLLFGSTLFFVHRYFDQSHVLEMTRFELKNIPVNMILEDADVLQTRIDSLRMRSEGFVDALDLLDSLLIGSDKWSRALERTSVNTENITGLWIERWEESSPNTLSMTGTATNRSQIVTFATKSGANIESLEFSSIREVPVYTFKMTMPLKTGLPEAAIYLREHAAELPNSFPEAMEIVESVSSDSTVSTRSM